MLRRVFCCAKIPSYIKPDAFTKLWRLSCQNIRLSPKHHGFIVTSKRRKGFPSEIAVRRGRRFIKGGEIELTEKLGRNDLCPCQSGRLFQEMLPAIRQV
ncbi:SEC-C metal-binding domain-containing protein [Litorimonas sp. RW-G-Af-16]|uniref:SEC-C metal-binding domain-containing protein n=1 Tax=Litorimonas sp. RW-G-Af-16 TaxID=3241168 RepID=UPI00390C43AF